MKYIFETLNNYNGVALVILTFVYVVATGIMVWQMRKANELTRQSLERSFRPFVVFNITFTEKVVHLIIKNLGTSPAFNVEAGITPPLIENSRSEMEGSPLLNQKISIILPQQEIKDFIGVSFTFFENNPNLAFEINLSYKDQYGKNYNDLIPIDLKLWKNIVYVREPSIGKTMENIGKALNKIAGKMK